MQRIRLQWFWVAITLLLAAAGGGCGGGGSPAEPAASALPYTTQVHAAGTLRRHLDVPYATRPNDGGAQFTSDTRKAAELGGSTLTLLLDVLQPPSATVATPQPLLVWLHGGGLEGGGKERVRTVLEGYARAGYVVAAVHSRLTQPPGGTPERRAQAIVQATEDVMNAIRHLRANAAGFGIDTTRTATLGYSAGGWLALANAVAFDTLSGTVSDYPGVSARTDAVITTGASLLKPDWGSDDVLTYDPSDTPVLLLHARPTDGVTGATWTAHVQPTVDRMNADGGGCTAVEQADGSHTADLSFGGPMAASVQAFLATQLRLGR